MKVVALIVVLAFTTLGIIGTRLGAAEPARSSLTIQQPALPGPSPATCSPALQLSGLDQQDAVPAACFTQYICNTPNVFNSLAACQAAACGLCTVYARCCNGVCILF